MTTQKRKFELFARLQALGFTYDEAAALRRIEMALQRWGERECNGEFQRDEATGKPYRVYEPAFTRDSRYPNVPRMQKRYPIADREAGALRRLAAIVAARNGRGDLHDMAMNPYRPNDPAYAIPYHQTDCRGCNLYLVTREQLTDRQTGAALPLDQYYTRGLAVCS